MKIKGLILSVGLLGAVGLTGCETMEKSPMTTGAVLGAGSGAVLGGVIGDSTSDTLVGAGAGALVGTGAGYLYDRRH